MKPCTNCISIDRWWLIQ